MAKLPALVSALAGPDGRKRETLDWISRIIRDSHHIRSTSPGGGAADMTYRDAANLLIGANGAHKLNDAPWAIERFGSLLRFHHVNHMSDDAFTSIENAETFVDALELLIANADVLRQHFANEIEYYSPGVEQSLFEEQIKALNNSGSLDSTNIRFTVTFSQWQPEIEIESRDAETSDDHWRRDFYLSFDIDPQMKKGFYGQMKSDRKVKTSIGFATIFALWKCLKGVRD